MSNLDVIAVPWLMKICQGIWAYTLRVRAVKTMIDSNDNLKK